MNKVPTSRQIEKWSPTAWEHIAGNSDIVRTFKDFALNSPCNTLVTGPWRSGKTRTVKHGIKSIICLNRTEDLNPCGKCSACRAVDSPLDSYTGLFSAGEGNKFSFVQIDCENIAAETLKSLHREIQWDDEQLIVYLDEVSALGRRGLDTHLLKPIDEWPCVWIASAKSVVSRPWFGKKQIKVDGLTEAVRNRFTVPLGTAVPGDAELASWIKRRCQEWHIAIENERETVTLLMKRACNLVGHVKRPLIRAATRGTRLETRVLSLSDVRSFNFEALD